MFKLSPAAQAVVNAYGKCISEWYKSTETEKSSSHYHSSGLAAVLRAAADHLDDPTSAHTLYAIADELER